MMSIRELVAWVLVIGLVVTLVNLKMKVSSTSSKPSRKEGLKNAPSALDDYPVGLEMTPNEYQEVRILEKELDKEARAQDNSVGAVSEGDGGGSTKDRRRSDSVPVSKKVRSSKAAKEDGSASPKRAKRKPADR